MADWIEGGLSRRGAMLGLSAAGLGAGFASAAPAQPINRHAPRYVVDFWRNNPANTPTRDTPSGRAPGQLLADGGMRVGKASGAVPQPIADRFQRKLDLARKALLAQPSLRDPHGVSIVAGYNAYGVSSEGGKPPTGTLSISVRPLTIEDKGSTQKDGRWFTPTEGDTLKVVLNPLEYLGNRQITPIGMADGMMVVRYGGTWGFFLSDNPLMPWDQRAMDARQQTDLSWAKAGAPGEHMMLVYIATSRPIAMELEQKRLSPAAGHARLLAAAFDIDWVSLRKRMIAVT